MLTLTLTYHHMNKADKTYVIGINYVKHYISGLSIYSFLMQYRQINF